MRRIPPAASLLIAACLLSSFTTAQPPAPQPAAKSSHARATAPHATTPHHEASQPLTPREQARQMLNRFTFGARPGDLEAVMKLGTDAWFQQQLDPNSIPDPEVARRLAEYPALNLPPGALLTDFPLPGVLLQVTMGKRAIPSDPIEKGLYEVLLYRYRIQQQEKANAAQPKPAATQPSSTQPDMAQPNMAQPNPAPADSSANTAPATADSAAMNTPAPASSMTPQQPGPATAPAPRSPYQPSQPDAAQLARQLLALPRDQRMPALMKLPLQNRMALADNLVDPEKHALLADFTPREREIFAALSGGPDALRIIDSEFQQAKILRAILSERQLQEVMTDFWFNHFNVFLSKDSDRFYTPSYERDAIRPHALGKFRDLLLATAQHPAMLVYLDNWQSIGPNSLAANRARQHNLDRGLNENYGREVMELHTVGVDAGYTQADVTNLARILTGWTIDQPQQGGGFLFDPKRHEPGSKKWFGQTIHEDGYREGVTALTWLARQPQTAHFISLKLAQRFVADDPPPALVDRMAQTFLSSDGDIKQVLLSMVHSPEFFSQTCYRNKVKTPLEFVASAFRATGTNPSNPAALNGTLRNMGQPPYLMQPPTGYPMTEEHWMNSTALIDRLNFSLALTSGHLGNMPFDAPRLIATGLLARPAADTRPPHANRELPISASRAATSEGARAPGSDATPSGSDESISLIEETLLGGPASQKTNDIIRKQLFNPAQPPAAATPADPTKTLSTLAAMVLGSPEFQMR